MTANPPLTPLAALRELLAATLLDIDSSDADLQWTAAVAHAREAIDHYTRSDWSGEDIKARRIALNLTQQDVADAIGAGLGTVRFWEQGRSSPSRAYRQPLVDLLSQPHERETR
jgi:DNA-binding transcriptional regulator YiaG